MRHRLLLVCVALTLASTGCVAPSNGTPSPADLDAFGVEPTAQVRIDEAGFSPAALEMPANSTLTVTNDDSAHHGVLQVDTAPDRRIETGDLVPGETVAIHLADPGRVELRDPRSDARLTVDVGPATP